MSHDANKGKRPAFQFYPGDWRRDTALQSCSIGARGLWIEMLTLMHDGEPYGHLTAGGVPLTASDVAGLAGLTVPTATKLLGELEAKKIFSRTPAGTIYSRRMVRDEDIRVRRARGGAKSLENANVPRPKDAHKDILITGGRISSSPSSGPSSGGSPAVAVAVASAIEPSSLGRLAAAANRGLAEHPTAPQPVPRILWSQGATGEALEAWQRAGVPIDFAESALYELAKSHRASEPITSLRYFLSGVIRRWSQHNAAADMAHSRPGALPATPDALTRWAEEDDA